MSAKIIIGSGMKIVTPLHAKAKPKKLNVSVPKIQKPKPKK